MDPNPARSPAGGWPVTGTRERGLARLTRCSHVWLPGYLKDRWNRRHRPKCKRVWLMFADHYEPLGGSATLTQARARVKFWSDRWPDIASDHQDSAGRPARYTFFYAEEQYHPELLEPLAKMTRDGIGDVEIHLHHDGEGQANFVDRMSVFIDALHRRHGLLNRIGDRPCFGFIHGDWALDNSSPDGRDCGLNNELLLLKQLGCYADFTFPAFPHSSQPRLVNTIYWATDDPMRPKSYDTGVPVTTGSSATGDLMIVPGPLALNWNGGRFIPRVEVGELAAHNRMSAARVKLWLRSGPSIGSDVFIKLFAHGAREDNAEALLTRDLSLTLKEVGHLSGEEGFNVFFVSAWEMRRVIEALQSGTDPMVVINPPGNILTNHTKMENR